VIRNAICGRADFGPAAESLRTDTVTGGWATSAVRMYRELRGDRRGQRKSSNGSAVLPEGGLDQTQLLWGQFIQGRQGWMTVMSEVEIRRGRGGARLPPQGQLSLPGGGIR
jgi:hypothetical protein